MSVKDFGKRVLQSTIGRVTNVVLSSPRRFLIVTRGRTGSNFLVSLLNSHPRVYQHGELFGEYRLRRKSVCRRIERLGAVGYFEQTLHRIGYEQLIGAKILYYQIEPDYARAWNLPTIADVWQHLQDDPRIEIIHLKRVNRLETLVSMRLADKVGTYVGRGYGDKQLILSVDECFAEFERIGDWEKKFDKLALNHCYFELTYEDLTMMTPHVVRELLTFLNIPHWPLYSSIQKQGGRSLAQIITNYDELAMAFSATPYAVYFKH